MAIAFYSATNIPDNSEAVDGGSGSNRLIVFVGAVDTADNLTAVTWNGEALTKGITRLSATTRYLYIWYLYNPSGTGTQTLALTGPGGNGVMACLVYTGVGGVPTDFVGNGNTGATSISNSHTTSAGDWIVGMGINNADTMGVGANTTSRNGGGVIVQADSNGVSSPTALNYTWGASGSGDAVGCVISPAGAGGSVNSGFFNFM